MFSRWNQKEAFWTHADIQAYTDTDNVTSDRIFVGLTVHNVSTNFDRAGN